MSPLPFPITIHTHEGASEPLLSWIQQCPKRSDIHVIFTTPLLSPETFVLERRLIALGCRLTRRMNQNPPRTERGGMARSKENLTNW